MNERSNTVNLLHTGSDRKRLRLKERARERKRYIQGERRKEERECPDDQ